MAIPLMESDILACDAVYEKSVPAAGAVEILRNKGAFAEYLKARELLQFAPSVYEQIDEVQYPFVLKRVDLNSSKGVRLVRSRAEYEDVRTQEPWLGYPSLFQEFIPGCVEYTMNAFFEKGVSFGPRLSASSLKRKGSSLLDILGSITSRLRMSEKL